VQYRTYFAEDSFIRHTDSVRTHLGRGKKLYFEFVEIIHKTIAKIGLLIGRKHTATGNLQCSYLLLRPNMYDSVYA